MKSDIHKKVGDKMNNIFITSCGVINENIKNAFYKKIGNHPIEQLKVLYITTASDGDDEDDKSWMDIEYKNILNLGIQEENITEYKIGKSNTNIDGYDIMYMMGGNTFYLLDVIRKNNFDKTIKRFIDDGKIYIGSSAGSEILGSSIYPALDFDENNVNMTNFTGLQIIQGLIIPHCNRKEEFIKKLKNETDEKLFLLYDGDGIAI